MQMWRNKLNLILEGTGWKRRGMMIGERVETENPSDVLRLGAENGARTRDLNLGKVALYQLSYFRVGIAKV